MICDIFCTIVAIAFNLKNFNSQFQRFAMILVQENIIRSILVVAINSAMLYATQNVTDPYLLTLYFAIQNWIYVFSLNAELLWIDVRKATHHNDVKRSMIPSPDRASSNMNQSVSRINQALSVVTTTDRLSAIKLDNQ
ncbi:hypothetical protein BCR33DRAFT_737848 [Rhizoclosmatium globosum]|uniref:Uncharacterized protein n=1 Tax=Rhizoclosmatium globosum TaxID=329046 RepID=A0A1Y2CCT8_9FUNG|nr:hypothetical protein BCR33DRAFT_737848 [Rhizoclosmatium globosum]|eukprot:ORY44859.1 hypothetical protein BCR33DRAFT_737848 [Rhizoclosmatium globosum]